MTWFAQSFLQPFLTSALVIALLRVVNARWASLRIYRALFDNRFRDKHPIRFALAWITVIAFWLVCYAFVSGIAHIVAPAPLAYHERGHSH